VRHTVWRQTLMSIWQGYGRISFAGSGPIKVFLRCHTQIHYVCSPLNCLQELQHSMAKGCLPTARWAHHNLSEHANPGNFCSCTPSQPSSRNHFTQWSIILFCQNSKSGKQTTTTRSILSEWTKRTFVCRVR
jgi:hypothetical protein